MDFAAEVSDCIGADFGTGLFVRADRLGGTGVTGAADAGAGEDSFRRLAGFGEATGDEGVGSVRGEVWADAAAGEVGAASFAPDLFPDRR